FGTAIRNGNDVAWNCHYGQVLLGSGLPSLWDKFVERLQFGDSFQVIFDGNNPNLVEETYLANQ
ncbi:MAG: hypothetical protein OXD01_15265, partial [Gammaproteobacteria bacterium]|nr:hypothetical protein [Gammaproteobacteria bacterium]